MVMLDMIFKRWWEESCDALIQGNLRVGVLRLKRPQLIDLMS